MRTLLQTQLLLIVSTVCTEAVLNLQIVSPLQALTIPDPEQSTDNTNKRSRFLARFRAGLEAEDRVRTVLNKRREAEEEQEQLDVKEGKRAADWAVRAAALDRKRRQQENKFVEAAHDRATQRFDEIEKELLKQKSSNANKYQFVGVINPSKSQGAAITWYARPKPSTAKWSVRLVHVNRNAIVKDLFDKGKVDVFASYKNAGKSTDADSEMPVVMREYAVRDRSWRNAWNFSPKHFFTDSSGMYWRERRLTPGLYTDGQSVFEATYRYSDGRNGMRRRSTFEQFMRSPAVEGKLKARVQEKLASEPPDVVLEEK